MRLTRTMRPVVTCLALLVSLGLAACSSGSDTDTAAQSGGGEDVASAESYCSTLQSALDLVEQSKGPNPPADIDKQLVDALTEAVTTAPAEVRGELLSSISGDPYAQEDLGLYNKEECGFDYKTQSSAP